MLSVPGQDNARPISGVSRPRPPDLRPAGNRTAVNIAEAVEAVGNTMLIACAVLY